MDVKFRTSFLPLVILVLLAVSNSSATFNENLISSHPHSPVYIAPEQGNAVLVDNYSECGVANTKSNSDTSRIVGGVETIPNEFPWQALIEVVMTNGENVLCGGSLIADQWILTAAHCIGQQVKKINVYLGVHNYADTNEINRKLYSVNNYIIHPDWNVNNYYSNDIALIKLSTTVTFTQYIRPICVASATEPNYVNELATVAGWGFTSDSWSATSSSVLRKVTVPVISNSECNNAYPSVITDKMICTSGANLRGPCKSDSGGPLNFKQSTGIWKQIGIVSFGSSLGCLKNMPSGYTRISSYSSWIQSILTPSSSTKSVTSSPSTTPISIPLTTPSSSSPETNACLSFVTLSLAISCVGHF